MMRQPEAAVIVPHYNDATRLARCLAALAANEGLAAVEIVVVDNGSDADPSPALAACPSARLVVETARGAAAARNRGVTETTAPQLLFLDADCVPAPGWLTAARRALDRAEVVGGRVDVFDETLPPRTGAQAFETVMAFDQEDYVTRKGFSVSANLLTWRRVFEAVGGFAPGVSEDLDWCLRAAALGWPVIYAPEVAVSHPTRGDMAALKAKFRRIDREMFALDARRPGARRRRALRAAVMLVSPLAHAHRFLLSPKLAGPADRLRGVAALVRLRACRAGWMARQALGLPV